MPFRTGSGIGTADDADGADERTSRWRFHLQICVIAATGSVQRPRCFLGLSQARAWLRSKLGRRESAVRSSKPRLPAPPRWVAVSAPRSGAKVPSWSCSATCAVGLAEGQALAHEDVGLVGRVERRLEQADAAASARHLEGGDQAGEHVAAARPRCRRAGEHGALEELEVPVVAGGQSAGHLLHLPGASPRSSRQRPRASSTTSGFFFCGMMDEPVVKASGRREEAELLGAVEGDVPQALLQHAAPRSWPTGARRRLVAAPAVLHVDGAALHAGEAEQRRHVSARSMGSGTPKPAAAPRGQRSSRP